MVFVKIRALRSNGCFHIGPFSGDNEAFDWLKLNGFKQTETETWKPPDGTTVTVNDQEFEKGSSVFAFTERLLIPTQTTIKVKFLE